MKVRDSIQKSMPENLKAGFPEEKMVLKNLSEEFLKAGMPRDKMSKT